jgi:Flp pilus assembly pilin Flp
MFPDIYDRATRDGLVINIARHWFIQPWEVSDSETSLDRNSVSLEEVVLRRLISKFLSDQSGSAAIEYGLIAAGIAVTVIGAVYGSQDQF